MIQSLMNIFILSNMGYVIIIGLWYVHVFCADSVRHSGNQLLLLYIILAEGLQDTWFYILCKD